MGCGVSKIERREEEMEHDSMYVYYNPLHHRPEDHLVERCREKASDTVVSGDRQQLRTKQLYQKMSGIVIFDLRSGGDKNNNNGVVGGTKAEVIVEQPSAEPVMKERNTLGTPSFGNYAFSGVDGSGETDDGEMRVKKLDIIIDATEKEDHDFDTCTEIILSTQNTSSEIACKNDKLPRISIISTKNSRRKCRRTRTSGLRNCSVPVKNLVDGGSTRRRRCYHSSDIL